MILRPPDGARGALTAEMPPRDEASRRQVVGNVGGQYSRAVLVRKGVQTSHGGASIGSTLSARLCSLGLYRPIYTSAHRTGAGFWIIGLPWNSGKGVRESQAASTGRCPSVGALRIRKYKGFPGRATIARIIHGTTFSCTCLFLLLGSTQSSSLNRADSADFRRSWLVGGLCDELRERIPVSNSGGIQPN
jgi:hypothetical protein